MSCVKGVLIEIRYKLYCVNNNKKETLRACDFDFSPMKRTKKEHGS